MREKWDYEDEKVLSTSYEPCGEDYLNTWEKELVVKADSYSVVIEIGQYEHVWQGDTEGPRERRLRDYCWLDDEAARTLRDFLDAFLNRERRDFRTNPVTDAEVEEALAELAATYGAKEQEQ